MAYIDMTMELQVTCETIIWNTLKKFLNDMYRVWPQLNAPKVILAANAGTGISFDTTYDLDKTPDTGF